MTATTTHLPYPPGDVTDRDQASPLSILISNEGDGLAGPIVVDTTFSTLTATSGSGGSYDIWNGLRVGATAGSFAVHDAHFAGKGGRGTRRRTRLKLDSLSAGEAFGLQYDITGDTGVSCTATVVVSSRGARRGAWTFALTSVNGETSISDLTAA